MLIYLLPCYSRNIPIVRLEDVFWTGIVAQKAGLKGMGRNDLFHSYQVNPVNGCMYSRIISSMMCKFQDPGQCNPIIEISKAHKAVSEGKNNCSATNIGVSCTWDNIVKEISCQ